MLEGLKYIKETFDLSKEDLKESKEEVNSLIVNDLLVELGYDRRRNKNVERIRNNNNIDWKITKNDKSLAIKTVKLESELNGVSDDFDVSNIIALLVTDGEKLALYDTESCKGNTPLKIYSLYDESNDTDNLLSSIMDFVNITEYINSLNDDKIKTVLNKYIENKDIEMFSEKFLTEAGITSENTEKLFEQFNGTENNTEDNINKLKDTIADKELEINNLNIKIKELEDGFNSDDQLNEKLNEALNDAQKTKEQLELSNQKVAELDNKLNEALKENTEINNKLSKALEENTETNNKLSRVIEESTEINNKLSKAIEENTEINNKLSSKENEIIDLNKEIEELKLNQGDNEILDLGDDSDSELIEELKIKLEKSDNKVKELTEKLNVLSSNQNTDAFETLKEYRSQIEKLNIDMSKLNEELENKENTIKELRNKIENKVDPKVVSSLELIESVEDNPNNSKSYVGVVDGNLFQAETINKFIGSAIQELYNIVTFELMQYLFDGDIFRITDKVVRTDMIIGNKAYDINLSEITEEDALLRLNTLFKKFPTVIFFSKVIGNKTSQVDNEDNTSENYDNITDNSGVDNFENDEYKEELASNSDDFYSDTVDNFQSDLGSENFQNYEVRDDNAKLYGFAISDIGQVLWDEAFKFKRIRYIGDDDYLLRINETSLNKQIEAILGTIVTMGNNIQDSVNNIIKYNFAEINSFVVTDANVSEDSTSLPYSRQYINCNQLGQATAVMSKYCELCNIDPANTYLYVEAECADTKFDNNIIEVDIEENLKSNAESNIEFRSNDDSKANMVHCIISGSIMNHTIINDNSYKMYKSLVNNCIAVRTQYLKGEIKDNSDVSHIVTEILAEADQPIESVIEQFGLAVGTDKFFISREASDVGDDCSKTQINGDTYYIADLEPWQLMWSLLKLHSIAVGDTSISIRVIMYRDALEYYTNNFYSVNSDKLNAVRSFVTYASTRLK